MCCSVPGHEVPIVLGVVNTLIALGSLYVRYLVVEVLLLWEILLAVWTEVNLVVSLVFFNITPYLKVRPLQPQLARSHRSLAWYKLRRIL